MKGCFDFTVDELGPCKVLSPIHLSKEKEDFRANYVSDTEFVRYNIDVDEETELNEAGGCSKNIIQKAGPREYIYFNPKHVNAGICTCGGLCPGINDVVRAIVRCLYNRYGVRRIRGVRFGFKGFFPEYGFDTIDLNPDLVDDIHKTGGSFLGTSRGGGDRVTDIVDAIEALNMNMLFIVGGDGTQRGALEVAEEVEKRGLKVSIVGVPKTVDNDLIFIGKDGNNSFRICVNSHTLKGYAQDGNKRLQVSLSHNRDDSQNTLQQGPSWLQGIWLYHYDEDKRPSDGDCIYAEVTIKGNRLKVIMRDSGSDFTYKYEGTWQYKDEGEGYFIYYFKDGGKGIEIDFDKEVLIVPDYKYVKDGDEWRRIYKYMKKVSD